MGVQLQQMIAQAKSILRTTGLRADGVRFLIFGAANTGVTVAAFQLYLFALSPDAAFIATWLTGFAFVVVFYPRHVFRRHHLGRLHYMRFALTYLAVFAAGLVSLKLLTHIGVEPRYGIFIVLIVTTSLNFVLGRLVLTRTFT